MMHQSQCKCPHHGVQKLVGFLTLVSALGFWISTLSHGSLFGISEVHYLKEVIVFGLLGMGMSKGLCTCCCGGCTNCSVSGEGMNKGM